MIIRNGSENESSYLSMDSADAAAQAQQVFNQIFSSLENATCDNHAATKPNKEPHMRIPLIILCLLTTFPALADEYIGKLSANPYNPDSTSNEYGQYGSEYSGNSINNPYSRYGSEYSNDSATNPYATNAPKLYDRNGNYRGKLSRNRYDPESVSNHYGRYGSPYSSDSINNEYGAGSPYRADSPTNSYGEGLSIYGDDDG